MSARHHLAIRRAFLTLALLMSGVMAPSGARPLAAGGDSTAVVVRAWPPVSIEPANLRVMVAVERNAHNRAVRISVDGAEYFSSSEATIDGDKGPLVRTITFRDLPAGDYMFTGEVIDDKHQLRGMGHTTAIVAPRGR